MDLVPSVVVLFGIPLVVTFILKSNAGAMFLSACAGLVLLDNMDANVIGAAGAVIPGVNESYIRLALVLLAVSFTGLVFRDKAKGKLIAVHIFIALLTGAMLWLTLPALSGVSWLVSGSKNEYWKTLDVFRTLVIATGFIASLLVIRSQKSAHHKGKH